MQLNPVGIDLAKSVFQLSIADHNHRVIKRRRLSRAQLHKWLATNEPQCLIMEACATSHFWGRTAETFGHQVRLLHADYVKPYVRRNKTDAADADALVEASRNPELKPIPIKTEEQQALQALHRIRTQWIRARTASINETRALLLEFGVTLPTGTKQLDGRLRDGIDQVPIVLQSTLHAMADHITALHERIKAIDAELLNIAKTNSVCQQLMSAPGVGVLNATALTASIQDIGRFPSARSFASWLGITPKEASSGKNRRLGKISRRGDTYLRTLLIHGARSALLAARRQATSGKPLTHTQAWVLVLEQRANHNVATVALANKMARALWAMWKNGTTYSGNDALCFTR